MEPTLRGRGAAEPLGSAAASSNPMILDSILQEVLAARHSSGAWDGQKLDSLLLRAGHGGPLLSQGAPAPPAAPQLPLPAAPAAATTGTPGTAGCPSTGSVPLGCPRPEGEQEAGQGREPAPGWLPWGCHGDAGREQGHPTAPHRGLTPQGTGALAGAGHAAPPPPAPLSSLETSPSKAPRLPPWGSQRSRRLQATQAAPSQSDSRQSQSTSHSSGRGGGLQPSRSPTPAPRGEDAAAAGPAPSRVPLETRLSRVGSAPPQQLALPPYPGVPPHLHDPPEAGGGGAGSASWSQPPPYLDLPVRRGKPPAAASSRGHAEGQHAPEGALRPVSGQQGSHVSLPNPCNCKRSRCLKLYCECFAAGVYCQNCSCGDCWNRPECAEAVQQMRDYVLRRNPAAFWPRAELPGDAKGCSCKRTRCLKKYCVCFNAGQYCLPSCKCEKCANTAAAAARREEEGSPSAGNLRVPRAAASRKATQRQGPAIPHMLLPSAPIPHFFPGQYPAVAVPGPGALPQDPPWDDPTAAAGRHPVMGRASRGVAPKPKGYPRLRGPRPAPLAPPPEHTQHESLQPQRGTLQAGGPPLRPQLQPHPPPLPAPQLLGSFQEDESPRGCSAPRTSPASTQLPLAPEASSQQRALSMPPRGLPHKPGEGATLVQLLPLLPHQPQGVAAQQEQAPAPAHPPGQQQPSCGVSLEPGASSSAPGGALGSAASAGPVGLAGAGLPLWPAKPSSGLASTGATLILPSGPGVWHTVQPSTQPAAQPAGQPLPTGQGPQGGRLPRLHGGEAGLGQGPPSHQSRPPVDPQRAPAPSSAQLPMPLPPPAREPHPLQPAADCHAQPLMAPHIVSLPLGAPLGTGNSPAGSMQGPVSGQQQQQGEWKGAVLQKAEQNTPSIPSRAGAKRQEPPLQLLSPNRGQKWQRREQGEGCEALLGAPGQGLVPVLSKGVQTRMLEKENDAVAALLSL